MSFFLTNLETIFVADSKLFKLGKFFLSTGVGTVIIKTLHALSIFGLLSKKQLLLLIFTSLFESIFCLTF